MPSSRAPISLEGHLKLLKAEVPECRQCTCHSRPRPCRRHTWSTSTSTWLSPAIPGGGLHITDGPRRKSRILLSHTQLAITRQDHLAFDLRHGACTPQPPFFFHTHKGFPRNVLRGGWRVRQKREGPQLPPLPRRWLQLHLLLLH